MRLDGWLVGLLAAIVVLVAASIAARDEPTLSVAAGALAVLAAAGLALRAAAGNVRAPARSPPGPATDALSGVRAALGGGAIGRDSIVYSVQALEFSSGLRVGPSMSPEEVRGIERLEPLEFRAWLSARLDRLEREA